MKKQGLLQVTGTPIGNLGDLSPRAQKALAEAALIACEDTRRTGQLLHLLGIKAPPMVSCFKENETARLTPILKALDQGQSVVLVSDGGMPAVSDPGARVVAAARAGGHRVEVIPGPTAVTTAIAGTGFEGGFTFVGFPERKATALAKQLASLAREPRHLVFYESPNRITATVEAALQTLGNRPAWLARELTKLHEEWLGPDLQTLLETLEARSEVKGECVLVIHAATEADLPVTEITDAEILKKLKSASAKDTAAWLADVTGTSKKDAYSRVQALKS